MYPTSSPQESAPLPQTPKKESLFRDIFKFTVIALAIVIPIRLFVAQPFIVSGASMDPTFETNDYLIVDQLSYRISEPQRGQVIIFRYPQDPSKYFIKRIIGLPGEEIKINGTQVTIIKKDGASLSLTEPYISPTNEKEDAIDKKLGRNEYYVLGDNRSKSFDSRSWGPVSRNLIIGTPFARLFPLDKISLFPGNVKEPQ